MRPLPAIAAQQCGVFSTAQAVADGFTISALRHAVASGLPSFEQARWRHAAPGIAAALTTRAIASHSTAAVIQGGPLLFLPERACVCVAPTWTGRIDRVHLH